MRLTPGGLVILWILSNMSVCVYIGRFTPWPKVPD